MIDPEDYISIVIPYYKRHNYLTNLLRSIHQYGNYPFEVVVHDDAGLDLKSTELRDKISTIVLNCSPLNVGLPKSLNRAISLSTSRYVLMLNEDLELTRPILREIVSILKKDYVGVLSVNREDDNPRKYIVTDAGAKFSLNSGFGEGCAMAFRRSVWQEVGGFREDTPSGYSDTPLIWKAYAKGYYRAYMTNAGVRDISYEEYRRSDTSISNTQDCAYPRIFGIHNLEEQMRDRLAYCNKIRIETEHEPQGRYNPFYWDDYSKIIVDVEAVTIGYPQYRWKEQILKEMNT